MGHYRTRRLVPLLFWVVTMSLLSSPSTAWGQPSLGAAVLPGSRAVLVGNTATAFATILATGTGTATGCSIAPTNAPPGTGFFYQQTNAANQPVGQPNSPATIPAGGGQTFLFGITPTQVFPATEIHFSFDCTNTAPAPDTPGVNTFLLTASSSPTPDIVALGAAVGGIASIPGPTGTGAFAVASVNVGATGLITVTPDTGGAALPVTLTVCQTNPVTGQCTNPTTPAASTTVQIGALQTPTFAVFAKGNGNVPFNPGVNRASLRFRTGTGGIVGATSVAMQTVDAPPPDVRGTYVGSGSLTQASCNNSTFNGTFGFSATVALLTQSGTSFTGSATLSASIAGANFVVQAGSLTGTVNANGQIGGPFVFQTFANGAPFGSGTGTFSGAVTGNTLTLQFSGQATGGCSVSGSLAATR